MLRDLMTDIGNLVDRATACFCGGDQRHFASALEHAGLLVENDSLALVTLDTPWNLRRPDSFTVHCYGMWTEMRALMMAHDDACLS